MGKVLGREREQGRAGAGAGTQLFLYRVALPEPIFMMLPDLTIFPKTASTVGLTSGSMSQISALEIGVELFRTVAQFEPS